MNSIHLWIIDDRGDNEEDGEDQDYEGNRYGDLKYFNTKHPVRQKNYYCTLYGLAISGFFHLSATRAAMAIP